MVGKAKYVHIQFVAALIDYGLIKNRATFYAYELYMKLCATYNMKPYFNQIAFSKFIISNFNYEIVNKKAYGKKFRVFVEVQGGSRR